MRGFAGASCRIGDEGPEAFSVDPSNGVMVRPPPAHTREATGCRARHLTAAAAGLPCWTAQCTNPRCIPEAEWLASEDYAQEQIAAANAAAAGGSFVDQWALDRMPIEVASELFLFFGASGVCVCRERAVQPNVR